MLEKNQDFAAWPSPGRLEHLSADNEASLLYNAACTYCMLDRKGEAMEVLERAWDVGFKDAV